MSAKYVMGVDPGKSGAFVAVPLDSDMPQIYIPIPLIGTNVDVGSLVESLKLIAPLIKYCAMEDVHSIFGASAKSNFQFGWINGVQEAALYAAKIPFIKVQPKAWQKVAWQGIQPIQVATGKKNKDGKPLYRTDTKATSLLAARRLYPSEKFLASARCKNPHDGWVDASLIAHWAKTYTGCGTSGSAPSKT